LEPDFVGDDFAEDLVFGADARALPDFDVPAADFDLVPPRDEGDFAASIAVSIAAFAAPATAPIAAPVRMSPATSEALSTTLLRTFPPCCFMVLDFPDDFVPPDLVCFVVFPVGIYFPCCKREAILASRRFRNIQESGDLTANRVPNRIWLAGQEFSGEFS